MNENLQNHKKAKVYSKLYEDLKVKILRGEIDFNTPILGEFKLAEKYGISRKSARKALGDLRGDGFLKMFPGKGTFAVPPGARQSYKTARNIKMLVVIPRNLESLNILDEYDDLVSEGVSEYCHRHSHTARLTGQDITAEEIVSMIRSGEIDGVIWIRAFLSEQKDKILSVSSQGIKQILINRSLEGITSVHLDYKAELRDTVEYLRTIGHRRIAFLNYNNPEVIFVSRGREYFGAMKSIGEKEIYAGSTFKDFDESAQKLFSEKPSAVVLGGCGFLKPFLLWTEKAGLKFPADYSLICLDDSYTAKSYSPPVSVYSESRYETGKQAAHALEMLLGSQITEGEIIRTKGDLIIRKSCAPLRQI